MATSENTNAAAAPGSAEEIHFIADQPIYEAVRKEKKNSRTREDSLDFRHYAQILSNFARSTDGPFTIGIHGSWGHGKTSLLRTIEKELTKNETSGLLNLLKRRNKQKEVVIPVRFNAWQFESEPNPLIPLVLSIKSALDMAARKRITSRRTFRQLRRVLKGVAAGVLASTEVKLDGKLLGASFKPASFLPAYRDQAPASSRMANLLAQKTNYYQAFQLLHEASLHLKNEAKIVLFIDDLDRCDPEKALQVLESIKLLLWQPGFIFFLAVDSIQLEKYIDDKYRNELSTNSGSVAEEGEWGRKYFEKLIQVSFRIPQHNSKYNGFIEQLYDLTNWPAQEAEAIKPLLGLPLGFNPRRTIKVLNTILLVERLLPEWFKKDIQTVAVEIILTIRFDKRIYQLLCGNSADENQYIRTSMLTWDESSLHSASQPSLVYTTEPSLEQRATYDTQIKEIWQILAQDSTLRSVLLSEPGKAWLRLEEAERRVIARLIEDQKIEDSFTVGDTSLTAKGNEAYRDGDYTTAFEYYAEAIAKDPQDIEAHIGLENTEHILSHPRTNNEFETITGMRIGGLWDIAQRSMKEQNHTLAEKSLQMIIRNDPENAAVYNRLGILHAQQKDYDAALKDLEKALEIEPTVSVFHNLGLIEYEMGDYNKALVFFKRALALEDTLAARHVAIAKVYEKLDNERLMFESLERAVELEPNKETYTLLMQAYEERGMHTQADMIAQALLRLPRSKKSMKRPKAVISTGRTRRKTSAKA